MNLNAIEAQFCKERYGSCKNCDEMRSLIIQCRELRKALRDVMEISEDPHQMKFRHALAVSIWENAVDVLTRTEEYTNATSIT